MAATYPNDPESWARSSGAGNGSAPTSVWPDRKSAEVAVIDTGVDATAPRPEGPRGQRLRLRQRRLRANDDNGHGTHVAGIIAARSNNKTGIAGVSRSRVYALKVLDASGYGTDFDIAQAIRKAADRATVKVINLSLGGPDWSFTSLGRGGLRGEHEGKAHRGGGGEPRRSLGPPERPRLSRGLLAGLPRAGDGCGRLRRTGSFPPARDRSGLEYFVPAAAGASSPTSATS